MELLTFDRSVPLNLALVGRHDFSQARYIPLDQAPLRRGVADQPYLHQMHCVANSVPDGLVARSRGPLVRTAWEVLGA